LIKGGKEPGVDIKEERKWHIYIRVERVCIRKMDPKHLLAKSTNKNE